MSAASKACQQLVKSISVLRFRGQKLRHVCFCFCRSKGMSAASKACQQLVKSISVLRFRGQKLRHVCFCFCGSKGLRIPPVDPRALIER